MAGMASRSRDCVRAQLACRPSAAEAVRKAQRRAHLLRRWSSEPCRLDLHVRLHNGVPGLARMAREGLHRLRRSDELRQRLDRARKGLVRSMAEFREGLGLRQSSGDWDGRLLELSGGLARADSTGPRTVRARKPDPGRRDLFVRGDFRLWQLFLLPFDGPLSGPAAPALCGGYHDP